MKRNFKKLILPIFLFAVLICSTLYFTYGNKKSMEMVRATDVTQCKKVKCTKPATEVFKCSANKETSGGRCICNTSDGEKYDAMCQASEVRCQQVCNAWGDNSSYSYDGESTACNTCPPGGSVSGSKCYTDYVTSCPNGYTEETSTKRYKCDDKIQSDGTCEKEDSSCISPWKEESVIVTGCVSKPSSMDCNSEYDGVLKVFFDLPNTMRNGKTSGVNAGTYTGSLRPLKNVTSYYQWCDGCGEEDVNYTCTISSKSVNVTWNGNTPSVNTGVSKDTMSLSVEYFDSNNNSLGTTAPTAPGSYKIVASCSGVTGTSKPDCGNYSLKNVEKSFEISSNKVNIPTCADKTYDGREQTLFEAHTSGDYTNTVLKGTDAGEYEVELTLATGLEWNTDSGKNDPKKIKCKINPKSVAVTWSSNSPFTCDGSPHSETPGVNTGITGETMTLKNSYEGLTSAPSGIGDYTVIASCDKVSGGQAKCENYTLTDTSTSKSYSISGKHVESITLSKSGTLYRGSTITLTPTFNPTDACNKGITWTSSDTSRATVNDAGVVTGIVAGRAVTITATSKDDPTKSASISITVYERSSGTVHVTGVTLDKSTADVEVGKTVSLTAAVAPDNATNKNVTWISSDTSKATVSGGVVTGVAPGTVTITVKTEDGNKTATATITVKEATTPDKPVTGVRLTPDVGTVEVGGTFVLEANIEPDNASNKNVTWRSSNPSVATVSGGVVTGVSAGTATITVETVDGNKTATAQVTVTGSGSVGETLEFERSAYSCEVGKKIYTAIRYSRDIQNPPVSPTVTSSDTSVATITTMTARECSSSTTSKCMTLDTEAIQRCVANGAVDINVEKCVPFYRTYYVTIDCKKAGTANLSASILEDIVANASVTVNAAGSEYSIVFHGNGGTLTYQGESSQSLTIKLPGSGTIGDATANITLSKPGYEFVGWFTETDGGIKYDETATFGEIGVSKLYAHWEAVEGAKFTLTYNANGGTACSPSSIEANINTAWGELCTPVRKGYDFAGWYTAKSGGKKITESSIAVENLIVYAQWKKTADSSPNTGITTPIIALLVVALVSSVAFFVVRKKRAQL